MEINEYKGETSQQFYISENFNGSYIIKTRLSGNNSAVEIKDAGIESGNIIQQWVLNFPFFKIFWNFFQIYDFLNEKN